MPSNTVHRISESKAQETFGSSCIGRVYQYTCKDLNINDIADLISSDLGGQVLEVSDEWFAAASNLINPAPPIRKPGLFVPTGAWYDGFVLLPLGDSKMLIYC